MSPFSRASASGLPPHWVSASTMQKGTQPHWLCGWLMGPAGCRLSPHTRSEWQVCQGNSITPTTFLLLNPTLALLEPSGS